MKKFKENNKGFSLVELIVVIAIMVVLIAVLGSTILGYVDKSKYSKDITALDSINTAMKTFVAEPKSVYTANTVYTLNTLANGSTTDDEGNTVARDNQEVIKTILGEVFTADGNFKNASKSFENITLSNVWVYISATGAVSIHVEADDTQKYDDYEVGDQSVFENANPVDEGIGGGDDDGDGDGDGDGDN